MKPVFERVLGPDGCFVVLNMMTVKDKENGMLGDRLQQRWGVSVSILLLNVLMGVNPLWAADQTNLPAAEMELYQDVDGEWKVKYYNQEASSIPVDVSASSQETLDTDKASGVEVELYQDTDGEWKIKYLDGSVQEKLNVAPNQQSVPVESSTQPLDDIPLTNNALEDQASKPSESSTQKAVLSLNEPKTVVAQSAVRPVPQVKQKSKLAFKDKSQNLADQQKPVSIGKELQDKSVTTKETDQPLSAQSRRHRWELGASISNLDWEDEFRLNNYNFSTEKTTEGMLYGVHAGFEFVPSRDFDFTSLGMDVLTYENTLRYRLSVDYQTGSLNYADAVGSDEEEFQHHIVEGRAVAGYDFYVNKHNRITPFTGVGYRYHFDPSGSVVDFPVTGINFPSAGVSFLAANFNLRQPYDVQSHYIYLPLGIMTSSDVTERLSIGVSMELDVLLWGMVRNQFSDIGDIYVESAGSRTMKPKDLSNSLGQGFGVRGSTRLTHKHDKFDLYVEPYIRYWQINQSDKEQLRMKISDGTELLIYSDAGLTIPQYWSQPGSTSTEYGVQMGVSF